MLKQEAESQLLGDESHQKTAHQNFQEEYYYFIQKSFCALYNQHRAPSMLNAVPASSVLGTFLSPRNVRHRTTCQLKASHQQRKSDRNTLKISYLMGCKTPFSQHMDVIQVEMLFTNFFVVQNIAVSAADHGIYSVARFRKSDCKGGPYIYIHYAQNRITMLKI